MQSMYNRPASWENETLKYLGNIDDQWQTKVPREENRLAIDDVPDTAFRAERKTDVDSRRRDVGANELVQVTMTQLLQL